MNGLTLFYSFFVLLQSSTPSTPTHEKALDKALSSYDHAWKSTNSQALKSLFCPSSGCLQKLCSEVSPFLEDYRVLSSQTKALAIMSGPGNARGVYAQTELRIRPRAQDRSQFEDSLTLSHFFLLQLDEKEAPFRYLEEFDSASLTKLQANTWSCPACNFEIARPEGWFFLPKSRGWEACTDSLSLLHYSGKLRADLQVIEHEKDLPAEKLLEEDNEYLSKTCSGENDKVQILSKRSFELSPQIRAQESEGRILRQSDSANPQRTHFYRKYLGQGPVLYSFNLYGDEELFRSEQASVAALQASFRILDTQRPLARLLESMRARHNPGSILDKNLYVNSALSVRLQGPSGWKANDQSGPYLFQIRFHAPKEEKVELSFCAIEESHGWADESSILGFIEGCREKMSRKDTTGTNRRRFVHRGLQTICYEASSVCASENPVREQSAYLPAGSILYILQLRAPANTFENYLSIYQAALDSLSRL